MILESIDARVDQDALLGEMRIEPGTKRAEDLARLVDHVRAVARPRALYRVCFVERRDPASVTIDGVRFESRALSHALADVHRVFPFAATAGDEVDAAAPNGANLLVSFWFDAIATAVLRSAIGRLQEELHQRYGFGGTSAICPGSGDADVWPIEEQAKLFALLGDVEAAIGVNLTDRFLMVPRKSLSGILFPTAVDVHACCLCRRERCPARRAPFDPALRRATEDETGG